VNRIYRLIWSRVTNRWVAVSETTRRRGKSGRRAVLARKALVTALSLACAPFAHAGQAVDVRQPEVAAHAGRPCIPPGCESTAAASSTQPVGGQVVSGVASIAQSGEITTIRQSSQDLVLNWQSFNIGAQETVDFLQPSAAAIAVNRILGTNGTQILGHLDANGQVWLINPNGVLFEQGAQVNVGGLVASVLGVSDLSLSSNAIRFNGDGTGSVINQGTINAANGGYVAFLANHVSNQGTIAAKLGTVALGAGTATTLTFSGNTLVKMQVDQSTLNTLAENGALIQAEGGTVIMSAGAKNALLASVVNNTGVIEARTVANHDGTIELLAGTTAGTVNVGGMLDASAPNGGNGGSIETSAAHVEVANGSKVTTLAATGKTGTWLIDPTDFSVAPGTSGDMTGATLSSDLNSTNFAILSSSGVSPVTGDPLGQGGNINVNDTVSWSANTTLMLTASNNVNVNANITATGNTAGLVINPNTANGAQAASGTGTFNLAMGNSITLSGANPSLSIAGNAYTVINSLGAAGSTTGTDLQGINGNLSGYYALGTNIDATATSGWNSGAGFTPIGNLSTPFTGSFDGLGHTVSNLTINLPSALYVGLFGDASTGSMIQDVGLVGGSIIGVNRVGGMVGENDGAVSNSYATGSVSGSYEIGGLVGQNDGTVSNSYATGAVNGISNAVIVGGMVGYNAGTISNSYATGFVNGGSVISGSDEIGGLVGANVGTVTNSYAAGSVNGPYLVGGLVGYSNGTVSNSYATGSVTGTGDVGGLVGYNDGGGTVSNTYATGPVSSSSNVGGLVGLNNSGTVNNSFWDITTSGQSTSAGGTGLTTAQMQTASNFTGFVFTTTPGASGNNWVIVDTDGSLNNAAGAQGATFPMLASEYAITINNAHQLQLIVMNPAASYTLGQNIDASATGNSTDVWGTSGFVPIGNSSAPFNGSFNGAGNTIRNVTINLPTTNYVGLFGVTGTGSVIQNVGLVGGSVSGSVDVGGLVGFNYGTVTNSYATGNASGTYDTGGLVGGNYLGSVSNSYATGSVSGASGVGGLAGANSGTVSNSYATGSVSGGGGRGSGNVGGLAGSNVGTVSNSYATGSVSDASGADGVGGLAGSNSGTVSNSYATGSVSGTYDTGGLAGYNYGTVSNSYATGSVSGGGSNIYANGGGLGGLVATNGGTIVNSYATGSVSGTYYVGGLVGYNLSYGTVANSYATGNVIGGSEIGGLMGFNLGSVSNSYATGTVSAGLDGGGLAGYNDGSVSNSYATGSVSGTGNVGGLVGNNDGGMVNNSYSTGSVSSAGGLHGGLVGWNQGGTVSTSFWDTQTSGQSTSAGGTGLTTAQMQSASSFTSWSIATTGGSGDVWRIYEGNTYPLLISFLTPLTLTDAPYTTVTYNGAAQSGPTTAISGVLGSAATGTNAGFYNGYYSTQQGYDITGGNLTIAPASLALNGTRVYDGTTIVAGSILTANGVAGQTFSVAGAGDPSNLTSKNVQTDSSLATVTGLTLGSSSNGGLSSNYYPLSTTGSSITITPLALTGASIASTSSTYGSTVPPGAVSFSNEVPGDGILSTASIVSPLYSTSGHLNAGSYAQTASGLSGPNASDYTFAGYTTATNSYTVGQLALTGAAIAAVSSTYGSAVPPGAVSFNNVISGDLVGSTASIVSPAHSTSGHLDAGSYTQTASGLTGADAGNYTFGGYTTSTNNYAVGQLALTVTGLTGTNRVYNGSTADTLHGTASIAPISGDVVHLSGTGSGAFANANVGTAKPVTVSGYSLTGSDAGNYLLVEPTTLTANVTRLASVAWVGGASGNWSLASNWTGGAIPDYANVAAVTIPAGDTVTYDSGVPGATTLTTLTSSGNLVMSAGTLSTTGNLSTAGYQQTGGMLNVGGSLMINSVSGGVTLGAIQAGSLSITSHAGAITQLASTMLDVTGASTLTAPNNNVTLANASDIFGGAVSSSGSNIDLYQSTGGLKLGATTATGNFTADAPAGAITQTAGMTVDGTSSLTAHNAITLTNAGNDFVGAVIANGSAITLDNSAALTASVTSTGATALTSAGALNVSGTVGTSLTTTTTGTNSATTFNANTAAGTTLKVTSTGPITQAASTQVNVTGASTLTAPNNSITLANASDIFGGAVSSSGSNIDLYQSTGGLKLGATTATGNFTADAPAGAITQTAGVAVDGTSSLTANNSITLSNAANDFVGAVTANGSAITLDNSAALTATVVSTGATALTSAGALNVSGTVGTSLTTKTTGTNSATTFGATTVDGVTGTGKSLVVTSTGPVTSTSPGILTVNGAGTTTYNAHVKVNGTVGALIQ
jgi:filamentous hemagglutinin family protein